MKLGVQKKIQERLRKIRVFYFGQARRSDVPSRSINTAVFARSTPPVEWSVDRAENIDEPGRMRREVVLLLLITFVLIIIK